MTTHDTLPATVLQRKAIVYVRQSTPQQVQANQEENHSSPVFSKTKRHPTEVGRQVSWGWRQSIPDRR